MKLSVTSEAWPIAGTFRISRGAKTEALVVVCTVTAGSRPAAATEVVAKFVERARQAQLSSAK